jgi:hypothetical protein
MKPPPAGRALALCRKLFPEGADRTRRLLERVQVLFEGLDSLVPAASAAGGCPKDLAFREGCAEKTTLSPFLYLVHLKVYQTEATSIEGFVQQLAVSFVGKGYFFYVTGSIPEGKDPRAVDEKLIARYGIGISKWARVRRKQAGTANLQYLRFERFFVLLATHGKHRFFEDEECVRDIRRTPIRFAGYSISCRGGHPHVRIEQEEYKQLKAYLLELAIHRSLVTVERELAQIPFEPYAPVRGQLLCILRAVNRARKKAGFTPVTRQVFRFKRRICRPFENTPSGQVIVPSTNHVI